jgi:hypothetical protein
MDLDQGLVAEHRWRFTQMLCARASHRRQTIVCLGLQDLVPLVRGLLGSVSGAGPAAVWKFLQGCGHFRLGCMVLQQCCVPRQLPWHSLSRPGKEQGTVAARALACEC